MIGVGLLLLAAASGPSKPGAPTKGAPIGMFQQLFSTDDYPTEALRLGHEGVVSYRLSIDPEGHVSGCDITASSGAPELDETTCRILTARATFNPARDANGQPVAFTYPGRFTWRIPTDGKMDLPVSSDVLVDMDISSAGIVANCVAHDGKTGAEVPGPCALYRGRTAPFRSGKPMHLRLQNIMDATALDAEPVVIDPPK